MGSEGNEREREREQEIKVRARKEVRLARTSGVTLARNFLELSLKFRGFPRRERFLGCVDSFSSSRRIADALRKIARTFSQLLLFLQKKTCTTCLCECKSQRDTISPELTVNRAFYRGCTAQPDVEQDGDGR